MDPCAEQSFYDLPSETSIRLLRIHTVIMPDAEIEEPSVFYSIHCFELDECPEFIALSYTWGDPMRGDINSTEASEDADPGAHAVPSFLASVGREVGEGEGAGHAVASSENAGMTGEEDRGGDAPAATTLLERRDCTSGTKNLRDGLVYLYRAGLLSAGPSWVWADAICIDQDNPREKAVQVAMMDEIYLRARAVIVWLGADETDLDAFAWLHGAYLDALLGYVGRSDLDTLRCQRPLDPAFTAQLGLEDEHGIPGGSWIACWGAYFRFYRRRRWFSRAWVVQEITLARQALVLCGGGGGERGEALLIDWERLTLLGQLLALLGWQSQLAPDVKRGFGRALGDEIVRLGLVKNQFAARAAGGIHENENENGATTTTTTSPALGGQEKEKEITGGGEQSLEYRRNADPAAAADTAVELDRKRRWTDWMGYFQSLLRDTRVYSATDPRDKIFSILGLARRALPAADMATISMPIVPDYSAASTASSVFVSAASLFVTALPRLESLSLVEDHGSTRIPELPSWVPDYTCNLTPTPLTQLRDSPWAFNCDPGLPPPLLPPPPRVSGTALFLHGAEFDRIAAVAPPMWEVIQTQTIDSLLGFADSRHLSPEYASLSGGEVLWRTLIADTHQRMPAPASLGESFKRWASVRLARCLTPDILQEDAEGNLCVHRLDETSAKDRLEELLNPLLEEARVVGEQIVSRGQGREEEGYVAPSSLSPESILEPAKRAQYLPTVTEVLQLCRMMYHFKRQRFIAQYAVIDPNDPIPTPEHHTMQIDGESIDYHNALSPCIPFRRVYRTVRGYLGLGPASAAVGDYVYMFSGAMVPFVVREKSTGGGSGGGGGGEDGDEDDEGESSIRPFTLMGETYLHGFMNGEMKGRVENEIRETTLV